jgi:hypothetical protein
MTTVLERKLLDNGLLIVNSFEGGISESNIITVVVNLMGWADQIKGMKGKDKKELILKVLEEALDLIADDSGLLGSALHMLVPATVDWLVVAKKDGLKVNTVCVNACSKTFRCLFACKCCK